MSINFPSYATIGTTSTTVTGDSTITSVTLLLHGDGANNANNTGTFIDSSTSSFTITRVGTPAQGSVNPFGSNWSNYFNGSTGYLTAGSASNWTFLHNGSSWTIEAWVYTTTSIPTSTSGVICGTDGTSGSIGFNLGIGAVNANDVYVQFFKGVSSTVAQFHTTAANVIPVSIWTHVAVTFNTTDKVGAIYINGVSQALSYSGTSLSSFAYSSSAPTFTLAIGRLQLTSPAAYFPGFISNLRISNSVVYNSNFTTSTIPLTTATNTVLLTCATNRFQDVSTGSNAITVGGTVSVQRFAPFSTSTSYSTSTTATVYSGSIYFNGSTDYLTISNYNTQFSTGNVTIEAYVYLTGSYSSTPVILDNFYKTSPYTAGSWRLEINTSGQGEFLGVPVGGGAATYASSSVSANLNAWNHVALVRTGNSITVYLNGIGGTAVSYTGAIGTGFSLAVGAATLPGGGAAVAQYFPGYISNPRIVGQAVYSANFTPPTAPLTAITSTNLLLLGTNGGIIDTTMQNNLVTVGSAQISTSTVKYGSGSIKFNGTTDYIYVPGSTSSFTISTSSFTIEMWAYWNNVTAESELIDFRPSGTQGAYPMIYVMSGNIYYWVSSADRITGTSAVTTGQWYHIAVARSGSSTKMFVNGTQVGSTYTDNSNYLVGTNRPIIGLNGFSQTVYFNGYIDDLRVTRGVARYTANFTAPTAAFLDFNTVVSTGTYTTYVTNFTQSGQVTSSSIITTSTGGTRYYTTSTGLFTGTSIVHIFTASGFFTATQSLSVSYLVVAGGGGGGAGQNGAYGGGGGGAGGFTTGSFTATSGIIYTITVGAGGSGSPAAGTKGSNGVNSSISGTSITTITAIGGGGGGSQSNTTGNPGGSGGGGGGAAGATTAGCGTPGQGNPGSPNVGGPTWLGSGGGGAGSAATTANSNGGNGASSSITGTSFTYAGGGGSGWGGTGGTGGGGAGALSSSAVAGTNGTGGGGGGGTFSSGGAGGASGGSGIVVLSYSLSTVTTFLYTINTTTYTYNTVSSRWVVNTIPTDTSTKVITPLLLSDQANPSTGFFAVSSGTTTQRPLGTTSTLYYTAGTGGNTYTTSTGLYAGTSIVHVFTATGTSYFTATNSVSATVLIVAGGGSGGGGIPASSEGAGGGAGGMVVLTTSIASGTTYSITVGAGAGASTRANGSPSTVFGIVAVGGGAGGGFGNSKAGQPGGSGGGGGTYTGSAAGTGTQPAQNPGSPNVTQYGNPGYANASVTGGAGGGGGAGGSGGPDVGNVGGPGGLGVVSTITGVATYYAGGGGGSSGGTPGSGVGGAGSGYPGAPSSGGNAVVNSGGGGGGASNGVPGAGGAGGPGIVVISYQSTPTLTTPVTSILLPIGGLRYNTDVNILEITNGTTWLGIGVNSTYPVEYLVVGGGGGGGRYGGGGAGGYQNGSINVAPGTTYTVTIGAGGTGSNCYIQGVQGSTSSFTGTNITSITAPGGGGGGTSCAALSPTTIGIPGGSGGGGGVVNANQSVAGGIGTLGQGNPGGTGAYPGTVPAGAAGGGGGGAGSAGTNATPTVSGPGGRGLISSINGTVTYYAGGGGGGQIVNANTAGTGGLGGGGNGAKYNLGTPISVAGSAGTAYTGGGGGGGYSGGSGIAIIRYPGSQRATGGSTVTTITVSGSPFTVHTFTATGAFIA